MRRQVSAHGIMGNRDHRHTQALVLDVLGFFLALKAAKWRRAALEIVLTLKNTKVNLRLNEIPTESKTQTRDLAGSRTCAYR